MGLDKNVQWSTLHKTYAQNLRLGNIERSFKLFRTS